MLETYCGTYNGVIIYSEAPHYFRLSEDSAYHAESRHQETNNGADADYRAQVRGRDGDLVPSLQHFDRD